MLQNKWKKLYIWKNIYTVYACALVHLLFMEKKNFIPHLAQLCLVWSAVILMAAWVCSFALTQKYFYHSLTNETVHWVLCDAALSRVYFPIFSWQCTFFFCIPHLTWAMNWFSNPPQQKTLSEKKASKDLDFIKKKYFFIFYYCSLCMWTILRRHDWWALRSVLCRKEVGTLLNIPHCGNESGSRATASGFPSVRVT